MNIFDKISDYATWTIVSDFNYETQNSKFIMNFHLIYLMTKAWNSCHFDRDINLILQSGDTTGRFFKYDIRTKQVMFWSYVLITEIIASRIRRFWLKGPKANSTEIFANLTGHPDNIKRTILGDYCVAVNIVKQQQTPTIFALAQRVDVLGNVVLSLNLTAQYPNSFSEVQEYFGRLYIGSFFLENFVGVYGIWRLIRPSSLLL